MMHLTAVRLAAAMGAACLVGSGAAPQYVGSKTCGACHAERYGTFRRTPMGRSLARISLSAAPEFARPVQFSHPKTGRHYRVFQKGPAFVIEEFLRSQEPGLSYSDLRAVAFAIGSGSHAHSFLVARSNRFFEAPVSYYTQAASWDMSPGYDTEAHIGFTREITADCLFCHAYRSRALAEGGEVAIGCERCHGPGGQHVLAGAPGKIVNPAKLPPRLRDQVCDQCHLFGAARVIKPDRATENFRPGLPLESYIAIYGFESPGSTKPTVTSHSEQMKLSRCWQASANRLWCGSCHEVHDHAAPSVAPALYRTRCMSCHATRPCTRQPANTAANRENNCIACHMPKTPVLESAHVIFTDHRILRLPEPPAPPPAPGRNLTRLLPRPAEPAAMGARDLGFACLQAAGAGGRTELLRAGVAVLEPLEHTAAAGSRYWEKLGEAYLELQEPAKAEAALRNAVRLDPASAVAQYGLGFLLQARGAIAEAVDAFRRATELDPRMASAFANLAAAHLAAGHRAEAATALERALELDPGELRWRKGLADLR